MFNYIHTSFIHSIQKVEKNLDVPQLKNRLQICGTYPKKNTVQLLKMKISLILQEKVWTSKISFRVKYPSSKRTFMIDIHF